MTKERKSQKAEHIEQLKICIKLEEKVKILELSAAENKKEMTS